jgi:hypothetical protein
MARRKLKPCKKCGKDRTSCDCKFHVMTTNRKGQINAFRVQQQKEEDDKFWLWTAFTVMGIKDHMFIAIALGLQNDWYHGSF